MNYKQKLIKKITKKENRKERGIKTYDPPSVEALPYDETLVTSERSAGEFF